LIVDEEKKLTRREYKGILAPIVAVIAVTFTVYHILYISGLVAKAGIYLNIPQHLAIHLGLILALVFLLLPAGKKSPMTRLPWYDLVLVILGVGWNFYIVFNFNALLGRTIIGAVLNEEIIGAWINILIVLEAARRLMGWAVPSAQTPKIAARL